MGFSKNRIRYLINKKNKFQTKKKYKKKKKEKRQKKNSFRKKKINIRNSSIKKKHNIKKNIANKKRKVYIIKGGGGRNDLNPYDQMIHDILVNVFNETPSDTTSDTKNDTNSDTTSDAPKWYDTSFLYNKNDIIKGEYIDRDEAIKQFKENFEAVKQGNENNRENAAAIKIQKVFRGYKARKGETLAGMDDAMKMECKADETLMMIDGNSNAITFNKTKCSNDVYEKIHNSIINIIDGSLN